MCWSEGKTQDSTRARVTKETGLLKVFLSGPLFVEVAVEAVAGLDQSDERIRRHEKSDQRLGDDRAAASRV